MRSFFVILASLAVVTSCGSDGAADISAPQVDTQEPHISRSSIEPEIDFIEEEIVLDALGGMWTQAADKDGVSMVIMVPGSGPTDRDGNNQVMKSNSLRYLAHGLAKEGISSIRVDKRGMFASADAGDANHVSVEIYARDYRAWAEKGVSVSDRECVFLLGHSEGGLMVSAAALMAKNICGIILVAAPGRPLGDVLREQLKANPANIIILKDAEAAISTLEAGERVDVSNYHSALKGLFNPAVQDYLISVFAVDPADILTRIDVPILIIQGENDIQVSVAQAERLGQAIGQPPVVIEGMNHVLKAAPASRLANLATYNSPDTPIDPMVVSAIANFIHTHR